MTVSKYVADFTYTDQEILDLLRQCLARIQISGQEAEMAIPGGGTMRFTSADIGKVSQLINEYQRKINQAAGPLIGTLYARMRRA